MSSITDLSEILSVAIKLDPALGGFTPDSLPEAAKARVANTLGSLERELDEEELRALEEWSDAPKIFRRARFRASEEGCIYYVFADGSLYFSSTGDSEVWAFAFDFATDKIINGYDEEITGMDAALLCHLGGFYAKEVKDRKASATKGGAL